MKTGKIILATFLSLGMLPVLAAPLRVMPLGDSITESVGWYAGSGYRAVLRKALVDDGYEIDMVGSSRTRSSGFSDTSISGEVVTDCEHEGHGGWTINEIRSQLPLWFRTISRATSRVTRNAPPRFVPIIFSQSPSVRSVKSFACAIPALLTRISMQPIFAIRSATAAATASGSVTSTRYAAAPVSAASFSASSPRAR